MDLFISSQFIPQGHCYRWQPSLVWLNVLSDSLIFLSYMMISGLLIFLTLKLKEIPFQRIYFLFGFFIFSCGLTHAMEVFNIWVPTYWLAVMLKILTAVSSVGTAIILPSFFPKIRALVQGATLVKTQNLLKQTERNYQQAAARLQTVLDHAPIILWAVDKEGIYTLSEGKALADIGLKPGQVVGMPAGTLKPDGGVLMRRVMAGETYHSEVEYKGVWLENYCAPIQNPDGEVSGIVGISTNITIRKNAEAAIHQSERDLKEAYRKVLENEVRFRATFSQAAVGMGLVGLDGKFFLVNQRLCEISGYSPDELVELKLEDRTYKDDVAKSGELFGDLVSGRIQACNFEKRHIKKDQSIVWVNMSVAAVRDESKELKYFITVIQDISEKIKAREAIVAINEDLEERVAIRTQELTTSERLLAEKNKELSKSNEDLEDFAYIASHDLKEPLRGINNYATFLFDDYADKLDLAGKEKLLTLKRLTQRLEGLIDSLLYYSRVGLSDLAVRKTNLQEVVEEVLDSLKPVIESGGVQVIIKNPLPVVICDSVRVSEIFLNLITNAIKYNDKLHKIVKIDFEIGPEGCYLFSVEDNGIGVKPEHYPVIFRMFRRLNGREKFGGGTGVGLTVVKKIVERHGGTISLKAAPNEGTIFQFTLGRNARENL